MRGTISTQVQTSRSVSSILVRSALISSIADGDIDVLDPVDSGNLADLVKPSRSSSSSAEKILIEDSGPPSDEQRVYDIVRPIGKVFDGSDSSRSTGHDGRYTARLLATHPGFSR